MKCPHCFKQVEVNQLIERKNQYDLCPHCKKEVARAIGMSLSGQTSTEHLVIPTPDRKVSVDKANNYLNNHFFGK